MSSIATLAVQLTAHTAPFTKNMKGATKSITDMQTKALSLDRAILGVAGRFTGIVSASAIATGAFNKLNQSFDKVEELGDAAAAIGASVRNLNALRLVTTGAGNDMEKTTGAIAKMTKALGDTGAEKAFTQIGLDPAKLRQLDSIDAFEAVAKQINKLPTAFDRAKAMNDLFGKSWIDMAEIVGNVNAIDAARAKLDRLELTITEMDTAMVDASNTAKREFFAALDAGFDKSAANMAPFKKNFFGTLNAITETMPNIWELMKRFEKTTNFTGYKLRELFTNAAFGNASKDIDRAAKATDGLAKATDGLAEAQKRQAAIGEAFNKAMNKIKAEASRARDLLDAIKTPGERYGERVNDAFDLLLRKRITQDQYDRYLAKSRDEFFKPKDKAGAMDYASQTYQQVGAFTVSGYLRNVANGTQINGRSVSGPRNVQQVNDPYSKLIYQELRGIRENTEDNTAVAA